MCIDHNAEENFLPNQSEVKINKIVNFYKIAVLFSVGIVFGKMDHT